MAQGEGELESYVTKTVGALPLLGGFLRRVGLGQVIDRLLPKDPQALLGAGEVTEALVANRLCSPRPLYRVEDWAERAGVAQVLGLRPEWLNDDRLGRVLDLLGENAKTLKGEICLHVARTFQVGLKRFHYDLTTVWLEGDYEGQDEPGVIRIEYTKDNPQELAGKGFRLGVSTFDDGQGEVSLAYQPLDGKASTARAALENLVELKKVLGQQVDPVVQVSDRAGVTVEVVATASREGFYVLGPLTMNVALKRQVRELVVKNAPWQPMSYVSARQAKKPAGQQDHYRAFEVPHTFEWEEKSYPARLLVVRSDGKRKRDAKDRQKHQQRIERDLKELQTKMGKPRWPADKIQRKVQAVLERYAEGKLYEVQWQGNPEAPTGFQWRIVPERIGDVQLLEGIYVAATTMPQDKYGLDDVFTQMKQQWRVEDSHRILKGPLRISPVFLHHPKRIEGLILVLWLALIVYQLLQRACRRKIQDERMRSWTTQALLRVFEGYSYVGVQREGRTRWIACVVPPLHRMIYRALEVKTPDST